MTDDYRITMAPSFHPILGWGTLVVNNLTRERRLFVGDRHEQRALEKIENEKRKWNGQT